MKLPVSIISDCLKTLFLLVKSQGSILFSWVKDQISFPIKMPLSTYWLSIVLLAFLLVLPGCGDSFSQQLTPQCPDTTSSNSVPVPPAAPAWQRSGKSSLELSLKSTYIRALMRPLIKSLLDVNGDFVPELQSIVLEEQQQNGSKKNLVKARFTVNLKKQDGTTTPLPGRNYSLIMEIYPELITPTTMPDGGQRKELLCGSNSNDPTCGNNGVVLYFYYSELDGGPNFSAKKVDCRATGYDLIDQQVLAGAYKNASVWKPIPIPLDGVLQFVTDVTKISANVTGVDLGTDQDLKLAVQLDQGSTTGFDSSYTQFSHFPDTDWLLSLDTSLLSSYISSNIAGRETQLDSSITTNPPVISFTQGGIIIDGGGSKSAGLCGDVPFTFQYSAVPKVCSRNGISEYRMCVFEKQPPTPHYKTVAQQACVGAGAFFSGLFSAGLAEAVISRPCEGDAYNLNLQLSQDSLYVTGMDLDNQFLILGRSKLIDTSNTGRNVLPQACQ